MWRHFSKSNNDLVFLPRVLYVMHFTFIYDYTGKCTGITVNKCKMHKI